MTSANSDLSLERAHAAEAVFDWPAFGVSGLTVDDFENAACRDMVRAAYEAWELGESGLDGVVRALQRSGRLDACGGRQGVMALVAESGAPDVDRMRLLSRLRAVQRAAVDAARVAGAGDLPGALERLQTALTSGMRSGSVGLKTGSELVEVLASAWREAPARRQVDPGTKRLRELVGGLPVGSMTVVGADSGVGKSSLALEMVLGSAEIGQGAALIGVEDPEDVTGSRLLGALSGISSRAIQVGSVAPHQQEALMRAAHKVSELGDYLLFADCTGGTEIDVMAAMSQAAMRGARLIAVDYLTEISASVRQQDRRNEVRYVAKQLKAHAKRLGCALVLVSQIARPESKNANIKPSKHHLKESGDVVNMAEVIVLLWRDSESDAAVTRAYLAKIKFGGLGQEWSLRRDASGRLVEV